MRKVKVEEEIVRRMQRASNEGKVGMDTCLMLR